MGSARIGARALCDSSAPPRRAPPLAARLIEESSREFALKQRPSPAAAPRALALRLLTYGPRFGEARTHARARTARPKDAAPVKTCYSFSTISRNCPNAPALLSIAPQSISSSWRCETTRIFATCPIVDPSRGRRLVSRGSILARSPRLKTSPRPQAIAPKSMLAWRAQRIAPRLPSGFLSSHYLRPRRVPRKQFLRRG